MEPFRSFISRFTHLNDEDWDAIRSRMTRVVYSKGHPILRSGQVCNHLFFLEQGLLRYFVNHDGEDVTKFFTEAPYLFTSQRSFSTGEPAVESIECLEESVVWVMSKRDAYQLLAISSWSDFVRGLIQEVQHFTEQMLLEVQTTRAEDRYRRMAELQPDMIRRIPLKHIASYLGIKQQSLSRIRKDMLSPRRI